MADASTPPRRPRFRAAALWLHRWLGLVAGLLLVPIGLSGSLLVFRPELDRLLDPHLHVVEVGDAQVPADVLLATLAAAAPGERVLRLTFPADADGSVMAALANGGAVYLDPYTGALLGVRGKGEGLTAWLFDLHHHLLAGHTGEVVTGWLGVVLLLLGVSGLVVWWRGRRRLRRGLTVARGPWRRTNYDLHNAVGAWSLPLLMLAALTGAALVFGEAATALAYGVTATPPPPAPPVVSVQGERRPLAAQLAAARAVFPTAALRRADLPGDATTPLRVRLRQPGERHPNGMTVVYVDPYTARVVRAEDALAAPLAARALHLRYPLHIGRYGGLVTRVLMVVVGLVPALLFVTGLVMWWKPKKRPGNLAPRPAGTRRAALPSPGRRAGALREGGASS